MNYTYLTHIKIEELSVEGCLYIHATQQQAVEHANTVGIHKLTEDLVYSRMFPTINDSSQLQDKNLEIYVWKYGGEIDQSLSRMLCVYGRSATYTFPVKPPEEFWILCRSNEHHVHCVYNAKTKEEAKTYLTREVRARFERSGWKYFVARYCLNDTKHVEEI